MIRVLASFFVLVLAAHLISSREPREVRDWDDYGSPPRRYHHRKFFRVDTSTFGYQGCMIGLSIGLVLGTIRAISLGGVPHAANETPCTALIGHIFGGVLSGALIGLVHVFLTQCVFRVTSD